MCFGLTKSQSFFTCHDTRVYTGTYSITNRLDVSNPCSASLILDNPIVVSSRLSCRSGETLLVVLRNLVASNTHFLSGTPLVCFLVRRFRSLRQAQDRWSAIGSGALAAQASLESSCRPRLLGMVRGTVRFHLLSLVVWSIQLLRCSRRWTSPAFNNIMLELTATTLRVSVIDSYIIRVIDKIFQVKNCRCQNVGVLI